MLTKKAVLTDFKLSMMGALDKIYTVVPRKGFLFHVTKNIYKRMQCAVMSQLYMTDKEFRTNIKKYKCIILRSYCQ